MSDIVINNMTHLTATKMNQRGHFNQIKVNFGTKMLYL